MVWASADYEERLPLSRPARLFLPPSLFEKGFGRFQSSKRSFLSPQPATPVLSPTSKLPVSDKLGSSKDVGLSGVTILVMFSGVCSIVALKVPALHVFSNIVAAFENVTLNEASSLVLVEKPLGLLDAKI